MSNPTPSSRPTTQPSASTAYTTMKVSQGSSRLYDIPSLEDDRSNFQTWKYRVMTVLEVHRLWTIADGTELWP
ncbi:hypothetical protein DFH29DRAFT_807354, partial [Suillus ampliporus]